MSLTEKNSYWTKVVEDIEEAARAKLQKERIRKYDFAKTLPGNLRDRVARIIEYEFDDFDDTVFITQSEAETPVSFGDDDQEEEEKQVEKKKPDVYNESTCSEIERMEHEFGAFDLVLEPPLKHKKKVQKKSNAFANYICKPRKERVQWDSKVYDLEKNIQEVSLDEQAERLMDASAERFTEWLNSLGDSQNGLTKEKIKALFSIEGDWKLSSSILTEPKEVKAIAKTVADKWNLPEMALELKYERYIAECMKKVPKTILKVVFGRTVPMKDRPWIPTGSSHVITPVFPDELLTFEKLFKGITHLRSTRALIDFYKKKPILEKPHYLVANGCFNDIEQEAGVVEMPLYELLKLKY